MQVYVEVSQNDRGNSVVSNVFEDLNKLLEYLKVLDFKYRGEPIDFEKINTALEMVRVVHLTSEDIEDWKHVMIKKMQVR